MVVLSLDQTITLTPLRLLEDIHDPGVLLIHGA